MTTLTAMPLPLKITNDSDKTTFFRELTGQFGDGYKQVAPDGINNTIDSWNIVWGVLTISEAIIVENALLAVGSWGILTWTPFGETLKKFRMDKSGYSRKAKGHGNGVVSISCKITQVFDL